MLPHPQVALGVRRLLEPDHRPLTPAERRLLRGRIRDLSRRSRRARVAYLPAAGVTLFALWLWTVLASNAPWQFITVFWVLVGGVITIWVGRDMRVFAGQFSDMAQRLEAALLRDMADVYDIRARRFALLEEVEDEGPCYAFELYDNRMVFISGQEFYGGARFPCLDFSLVYPLDATGRAVDLIITKTGPKAAPARIIPAASRQRLATPEQLEVRDGRIDDLEAVLAPSNRG